MLSYHPFYFIFFISVIFKCLFLTGLKCCHDNKHFRHNKVVQTTQLKHLHCHQRHQQHQLKTEIVWSIVKIQCETNSKHGLVKNNATASTSLTFMVISIIFRSMRNIKNNKCLTRNNNLFKNKKKNSDQIS